jgi:hypothetical protein
MEPLMVVSLLGTFMLVMGAAISRLQVGQCPECPHCRNEARVREAREQATVAALDRRWNFGTCPRCGRAEPHEHER